MKGDKYTTEALEQINTIVAEPVAAYATSRPVSRLESFEEFISNKLLVIRTIHRGVTFSLFETLAAVSPFTTFQWASFLGISVKSLQRYKQDNKTFKPVHSEKIIEIAEVNHKGIDTFGSKEKYASWLNSNSYALGGHKPIDLLRDSYGKDLVISELVRIDHGVLA